MLNTKEIKHYLAEHFDLVGVCPAVSPQGLSEFYSWLDSGYAGEMDYMPDRRDAYAHPRHVMDGARSIIMLGSKYADINSRPQNPLTHTSRNSSQFGWVARYARSQRDYHDVIHQKLKVAKKHFEAEAPSAKFRGVVDTAPLLEREFAQLAGIGWQGKNTMLISKTEGSWFFLSAILTDQELEYDPPFKSQHCGTCTACLDACPTDAFVDAFQLDARKCISYWNIESQQIPDTRIRSEIGTWLFGCDICQEVCPWNRKEGAYVGKKDACDGQNNDSERELVGKTPGFQIEELIQMLDLDEPLFRARFRKTPFWRSKRRGFLRNVLIVLGNLGQLDAVPAVSKLLADSDSMIRAVSAWALGEIKGADSHLALTNTLQNESSEVVREEIEAALSKIN